MNDNYSEFTDVCRWRVVKFDGDVKNAILVIERGSFAYMEWAYFEGIHLPHKVGMFGCIEPFEKAYDRMKRYYKLPYELRKTFLNN